MTRLCPGVREAELWQGRGSVSQLVPCSSCQSPAQSTPGFCLILSVKRG